MYSTDMLQSQLTRSAMEAHLRLHGWVPCTWGACAARRGTLIVYAFYRDQRLEAGHHQLKESELDAGGAYKHDVDDWWQSHSTFGCMAREITRRDYGHATNSTGD